jgi:hypothetical protein
MEELRLRMSENMVLRRLFGPKKDEVSEEWRKLLSGWNVFFHIT